MSRQSESSFLKQSVYDQEFKLEVKKKLGRLGDVLILSNSKGKRIMAKEKIPESIEDCKRDVLQAIERMKLNHPHLLKMHDYSAVFENGKYSIKGYYESPETDLESDFELKKVEGASYSADELRNLLVDMLEIITYLKEKKMIHGDIRPEYIMFDREAQIYKLADRLGDPSPPTKVQARNLAKKKKVYLSPQLFYNLANQANKTPGFESLRLNPYLSEGYSLGLVVLEAGIMEEIQDIFDIMEGRINETLLSIKIDKFIDMYQDKDVGLVRAVQDLLEVNEEERPDLVLLLTGLKSTPQDSGMEDDDDDHNYIFRDTDPQQNVIEERTEDEEEDDLPLQSDRDYEEKHNELKRELESYRDKVMEDEMNNSKYRLGNDRDSNVNVDRSQSNKQSEKLSREEQDFVPKPRPVIPPLHEKMNLIKEKEEEKKLNQAFKIQISQKETNSSYNRIDYTLPEDKKSNQIHQSYSQSSQYKESKDETSMKKESSHASGRHDGTAVASTHSGDVKTDRNSDIWDKNLANLQAQRDELMKTLENMKDSASMIKPSQGRTEANHQNHGSQQNYSGQYSNKSNIFKPDEYQSNDETPKYNYQKQGYQKNEESKSTLNVSKQTNIKEENQTKASSLAALNESKGDHGSGAIPKKDHIQFDYNTDKYKLDKHNSGNGFEYQSMGQQVPMSKDEKENEQEFSNSNRGREPSYVLLNNNNRDAISFHDPIDFKSGKGYDSNPFKFNETERNMNSRDNNPAPTTQHKMYLPLHTINQQTTTPHQPITVTDYSEVVENKEQKTNYMATGNSNNLKGHREVSPQMPSREFSSSSVIRDITPGKRGDIGLSQLERSNATISSSYQPPYQRNDISPRPNNSGKEYDTSPQLRLVREGETSRIGNEENKPPTTYTPVKQNKNMDNRTNINYNSETSPILKEKKIVQPNNTYSYKDQPGVSMKHSLDSTPQAYKPISYSGIHSNNNDSRTNLFPSSKPRDVSPMSNSYILPQSSSQVFSSSNMNNNQTYKDHTIRDMIPDSRSVSPIQSHDNRRHFQANPEPVYVQNRNGEYRPVQSSSNELSLAPNSIQFKQIPYTVSSHEDREDGFTQGAFGETSNFYHPPPASTKQSDDTNTQKFYPPGLNYYPVVITKAQELDLRPIVIRSRSNTPIRNTLGGLTAVAEGVSRVTGNPGLQFPKDRSVSPVPSTFKDQPLMRQSGTSTMTHPGSVNTGATNLADHISMGYSAMQRNPQTSLSTSMYYPHTQGQTTSKQFETPSHTSYINNSQYIASSQYAPHSHHHEYNPNIPQDAKVLQFVTKSKTSHHDIENQRKISPIRTVKVIRNGVEYSEQNAESASVKYPQNPQHFPRFVQNNHP